MGTTEDFHRVFNIEKVGKRHAFTDSPEEFKFVVDSTCGALMIYLVSDSLVFETCMVYSVWTVSIGIASTEMPGFLKTLTHKDTKIEPHCASHPH
ncbi:hypothetical protein RRG08_048032 [Elysia crispata]|uniref:Uncharacterized protein n=1 Tax=Elysia crispata TaxID=231223 RepID=A0AAE1DUA0_9GAST|nr:hypothetical protein RRG08_048032 [Elysia crispata]